MLTMEPELLTVDEVARRFRVTRQTIARRANLGHIPHIRLGKSIRIPAHWVEDRLAPVMPRTNKRSDP